MPEEEINRSQEENKTSDPGESNPGGQCCGGNCGDCPAHSGEGRSPESDEPVVADAEGDPETGALVEKGQVQAAGISPAGEDAVADAGDTGDTGDTPESGRGHEVSKTRRPRMGILCTALHGKMSHVDFFTAPELTGFPHGSKVILRTDRGTEMGTIIASPQEANLAELKKRPGEVIRAATREDIQRQRQIEKDIERNELSECAEEVAGHKLPMKLVAAEHLFGGEKIIFYFMSDGRVDFRKLVRDMAARYRTRIEFRQIGVRDEARLLAEYEHCGQPLCCRQFLRGLEPVTMRMAKLQKATLDPAKISGRCGRLMCCLRYEEDVYQYLRKQLPPRGVYVLTGEVAGQVVSTDIISQRVTINTGQRRVDIKAGDIVRISRQPIEQPVADVPAEISAKSRESSAAVSPGRDGEKDQSRPRGRRNRAPRSRKSVSGSAGPDRDNRKSSSGGRDTGERKTEGGGRSRGGRRRGGRSRGGRGRSGKGGGSSSAGGQKSQ